jgi:hypothetical protein
MSNLDLKHQSKHIELPKEKVIYIIDAIEVDGDTLWYKVKDTTINKPFEFNFDNYLKVK